MGYINFKGNLQKTSRKISRKDTLIYQMMIMPSTVLYILFVVYPFFATVGYSFTDYSNQHLFDYGFVGLDNYIEVLTSSLQLATIGRSLLYAVLMTAFQLLFSIPLAVILTNTRIKGKSILRTAFYFPAVISALIIGYIWSFLFSTSFYGPINNALKAVGLPVINFFGNPDIALYSIVFTQVWQWTGWAMIIISANIASIPTTYFEAARIDGAGPLQQFVRITFPLLHPAISVIVVSSLIGGLKVYDIIVSTTGGGPAGATLTIMGYIINHSIGGGYLGLGSAFSVVFFLVLTVLTVFLMKGLNKWEENVQE